MLTLEMLYAVLQGLPSSYLTFLDHSWSHLCWLIERALNEGHGPEAALRVALSNKYSSPAQALIRVFSEVVAVNQIPDLSRRQRETLIALRYSKVASLRTLTQILATDRSNVHKRLKVLVERGLAIKFFRPNGVHYLAIHKPLEKSVKITVNELVSELMQKYSDQISPTTTTTPTTTPTPPTIAHQTTPGHS